MITQVIGFIRGGIPSSKQQNSQQLWIMHAWSETKEKRNVDLYRDHKGSMRQLCLTGKLPPDARYLSLQQGWNYLLHVVYLAEHAEIRLVFLRAGHVTTAIKKGEANEFFKKVFFSWMRIVFEWQRWESLFKTLRARLQALLPSFSSVSKGKLMQNVYGPWHKRWCCGSVQEDLCAKSFKHLCKHMAFFQPCRQCSHSLKIDVQGNIPCPGAVLEWIWTSENLELQAISLSIFQLDSKGKKDFTYGFYLTLGCS